MTCPAQTSQSYNKTIFLYFPKNLYDLILAKFGPKFSGMVLELVIATSAILTVP